MQMAVKVLGVGEEALAYDWLVILCRILTSHPFVACFLAGQSAIFTTPYCLDACLSPVPPF